MNLFNILVLQQLTVSNSFHGLNEVLADVLTFHPTCDTSKDTNFFCVKKVPPLAVVF